jgi:hypothetical protein
LFCPLLRTGMSMGVKLRTEPLRWVEVVDGERRFFEKSFRRLSVPNFFGFSLSLI